MTIIFLDWGKPYTTRIGRRVRIWTRNAKCGNSQYPVRGEVEYNDNLWSDFRWSATGECYETNDFDLVNVPEKHVRWVVFYPESYCAGFASREEAMRSTSKSDRLACKPVEFTEGEGL